jgi:integral membrane protein
VPRQEGQTRSSFAGLTGAFRLTAYVEAVTYLALLAAVVLYRVLDGPDFVSVLGPIHGVAFLVYFGLVMAIREDQGWGLWRTVLVILASAVPFGGFWAARHLDEREATGATSSV